MEGALSCQRVAWNLLSLSRTFRRATHRLAFETPCVSRDRCAREGIHQLPAHVADLRCHCGSPLLCPYWHPDSDPALDSQHDFCHCRVLKSERREALSLPDDD